MKTPWELLKESKIKIKTTWRIAFVSALVLGSLIHLPVMLSDIPNHDGTADPGDEPECQPVYSR